MASLQELLSASFRGVPFLVPEGTKESGRHEVRHDYPDSSQAYIEDNGLRVPQFKVQAIVHGASALSWLRRLEGALNAPGPATLVHPIYGRQWCQAGQYNTKHDDKEVGVYHIDITFHVTGPPVFPGPLSGIAAAITGLSTSALVSLFNEFQSAFVTPVSTISQLVLGSAVGAIVGAVSAEFGNVETVGTLARQFARTPELIVSDATRLGPMLSNLMRAPFDDTSVPQDRLWLGMQDVGNAAIDIMAQAAAISGTTPDLSQRAAGMAILGATMQEAAFVSLCEAAAGKDYATTQEVANDVAILSDHRRTLSGLSKIPAIRTQIDRLYAETMAVLQKDQVTLPDVVQMRVNELPASQIAYNLYEGMGYLQTVVGLNAGQSAVLYDETVNVLCRH